MKKKKMRNGKEWSGLRERFKEGQGREKDWAAPETCRKG